MLTNDYLARPTATAAPLEGTPRTGRQHVILWSMRLAVAVVGVHVVNASLFHIEAPFWERLLWAVAAAAVASAAVYYGPLQKRAARGAIALVFGLPAFAAGIGIHAIHVYQLGVKDSDFTGIPMLVAGLLLTIAGTTDLVRLIHTWWRRLIFVPLVLVLALFVLFPVTLGIGVTNVAHVPCCHETPADRGFAYEDVRFATPAGLDLSAWFIPTQNGAVVITVHGAGNNRATVMDEAAVLARHGYGVLMVDLEGFGDSEGRANALGWVGARGVHAAINYLRSRPDVDPERIGGLGLSMGGEVLLQAAGESRFLKAIVSEGATSRTAADIGEIGGVWLKPVVLVHEVAGATIQLISGESPPPPLKRMAQQIAPRRVLLISARLAEEEELMGLYVAAGGPSFEMWTIPEAKHVGAFDLHPQEYEQRVVSFFDEALLGIERGADPLANPIP